MRIHVHGISSLILNANELTRLMRDSSVYDAQHSEQAVFLVGFCTSSHTFIHLFRSVEVASTDKISIYFQRQPNNNNNKIYLSNIQR